jgi:hypothetical protein
MDLPSGLPAPSVDEDVVLIVLEDLNFLLSRESVDVGAARAAARKAHREWLALKQRQKRLESV